MEVSDAKTIRATSEADLVNNTPVDSVVGTVATVEGQDDKLYLLLGRDQDSAVFARFSGGFTIGA